MFSRKFSLDACYRLLACVAIVALGACSDTDGTDSPANEEDDSYGGKADNWGDTSETISFEEFRDRVYCEPDTDICITEGDLPIPGGEEGLRDFYDARVGGDSALTVRHAEGVDTRWTRAERLDLTYCVDDAFGERKGEVIEAMSAAAGAWEEHGHLKFRYVPEADGDCEFESDAVIFPVTTAPQDATYFARAFFPDYDNQDRQVRINLPAMDDSLSGSGELAENLTMEGVLRHELGHVLGFRHEHTRPETNYQWCFEDEEYRPVTEYDSRSVMHYPQCNGDGDWSLELTEIDRQGTEFFYPDYERFPMGRCDEELDEDGYVLADCAPVAHMIVEFANSASREALDDWAGLDLRAVDDIMATREQTPFHTLADLKEMHYLKEHGVRKLYDYLYVDGRCPEELDEDGRPLATCWPVALSILELANTASLEQLDDAVSLDSRAAQNIVDARQEYRFESLAGLWLVKYVKTRALGKMYDYLY